MIPMTILWSCCASIVLGRVATYMLVFVVDDFGSSTQWPLMSQQSHNDVLLGNALALMPIFWVSSSFGIAQEVQLTNDGPSYKVIVNNTSVEPLFIANPGSNVEP